MRVAITGGTGFVGAHLAKALVRQGHQVVLLARGVDERPLARETLALPVARVERTGVGDPDGLLRAFRGADAVAHCAGINRELGRQTYAAVHVQGTRNVVAAAERAGVRRLALLSFLRARPDCGSGYHESKWAAEQIVRASAVEEWTVLKPGMMYGRGDHMLDHLSHALHTLPVFADLGRTPIRPLAIADAVDVLVAALVGGRLPRRTVPLTGPTELALNAAVRLVGEAIGRRPPLVPLPFGALPPLAWVFERTMRVPMLSLAQARILREGVVEPVLAPDPLPADLAPRTPFDLASVKAGLPAPGPFTRDDWRVCMVCAWQG